MVKINKTLVTVIATVGFIISLIQMSLALPGPEIGVEIPYIELSSGDTFTVNITVAPDGIDIMGAQYELHFNNKLLNATSQTKGTFFSQDGASTMVMPNAINNTLGKTEYSEFRTVDYGVTTPGVLARITFKAIEPGTSNLNLSNVILSDTDGGEITDVSVNNVTFVIGTSPTPAPTQSPTPTPTSTPTPTPTPANEDDGNEETTVTPTPIKTPTITPTSTVAPTPTQTPTINPVPSQSPPPSPTTAISPTTSLPPSEKNNKIPGFEAAFALSGLLAISYFILKRGGGNK